MSCLLEFLLDRTKPTRRILERIYAARAARHAARELACREESPLHLGRFEAKVHSMNGEDGILAEIFRRIGTTDRRFVEFGIGDGSECNTRLLAEQGWSGLWLEADPEGARRAKQLLDGGTVQVLEAFVTAGTINELLDAEGSLQIGASPAAFDLLVIDIDGNDYHVWKAIETRRPRVVVIEYNARFPPPSRWIMPYDPGHVWDRSDHCGASLESLADLGRRKGYGLVACDSRGVNAFFVREDLVQGRFHAADRGAAYHYACPKYGPRGFGWRAKAGRLIGRIRGYIEGRRET